jgi:hypothetical protein
MTYTSFRLSDPPLHYVGRFCSTWVRGLVINWALQKDPPSHPYPPTFGEEGTKKWILLSTHRFVQNTPRATDHWGFNISFPSGGFHFCWLTFSLDPNVMVESGWIPAVPHLNFGPKAGNPEVIRGFRQYPWTGFRIHYILWRVWLEAVVTMQPWSNGSIDTLTTRYCRVAW